MADQNKTIVYPNHALDPARPKSIKIRIVGDTVEETMVVLKRIYDMLEFGVLAGKGTKAKSTCDFDFSIRDCDYLDEA